jgi:hypothetical protein
MRIHSPSTYGALDQIALDAYEVADESGWHSWMDAVTADAPVHLMPTQAVVDLFGPSRILANLMLICSEAAEATEAVRKNPAHIQEELADIVIRTLELANMLGCDRFGDCVRAKMEKNRARNDVPARAGGKVI